jgi:hypothetical protein
VTIKTIIGDRVGASRPERPADGSVNLLEAVNASRAVA